jgi:hypothetical protein
VGHPERFEDVLPRELGERHPADARDHDRGEVVVRVAVVPHLAWQKVQRALVSHEVEHRPLRVDARAPRPAGDVFEGAPIAQSARVRQHAPQRDGLRVDGELGQVRSNVLVERELALLCEERDGGARELLGDRCRLEDRFRRVGGAVVEVREPVRFRQDGSPLARDADDAARAIVAVEFGEDFVDRDVVRVRWRRRQWHGDGHPRRPTPQPRRSEDGGDAEKANQERTTAHGDRPERSFA